MTHKTNSCSLKNQSFHKAIDYKMDEDRRRILSRESENGWSYGLISKYEDEIEHIDKVIYFSNDIEYVKKRFNSILKVYYQGKTLSKVYHTLYLFKVYGVNPDLLTFNILSSMTRRAYICIFHNTRPRITNNLFSSALGKKFIAGNDFLNYVAHKEIEYTKICKKTRKELINHIKNYKQEYNDDLLGIKWYTTPHMLKKRIYKDIQKDVIDHYEQSLQSQNEQREQREQKSIHHQNDFN